ncbi:MAG: phage tail protein [Clostridiales bacterium]|nr:phage tail protein [Clostridiales bacterium]
MENNNNANVSTGKPKATGAIFVAPTGTPLPMNAVDPLSEAFKNLGYASEDGVTNASDESKEEIKAWGGSTVLTVQTKYGETFQFVCIETNIAVLKEYYGAENVTEDRNGNITIKSGPGDASAHPWVIEMLLNSGRIQRIVIPNGKLGERGDITYTDGDAIGYDMTITALPDDEGKTAYRYIATPIATPITEPIGPEE